MRCATGEIINEIIPAAGHANRNAFLYMSKNAGVYPRLIGLKKKRKRNKRDFC